MLEVLLRRILTVMLGAAVAAVLLTSALASASTSRATLQLRRTSLGAILVDDRDYTVYAFSKDSRNKDNCAKIGACLGAWPLVATPGKPVAGKGVNSSLIGAITLKSGARQVTYAGHPLYTYVGDSGPGEAFYVNIFQFGGFWPAVNAAGRQVK